MMKLIHELVIGERGAFVAYVLTSDILSNPAGKSRLLLTLSDCTGTIEAIFWNIPQNFDRSFKNSFVRVQGSTGTYNERLQFTLDAIPETLPEPEDLSRFFATSPIPLDRLIERLNCLIHSVEDACLKALLEECFCSDSIMKTDFFTFPAAKSYHHAYRHGLLHHSVEVAEFAKDRADRMIRNGQHSLSHDLVVAGALLHDIGKCKEYRTKGYSYEFSEQGALLGHLTIGMKWVENMISRLKLSHGLDFSQELSDALQHILLSHHGRLEYGSPVLPKFIEAEIVHRADEDSSTFHYHEEWQRGTLSGRNSDYQRKLHGEGGASGRRLYAGSVGILRTSGIALESIQKIEVFEEEEDLSIPQSFKLPIYHILEYLYDYDYDYDTPKEFGAECLVIYGGVAAGTPMLNGDCTDGRARIKVGGAGIARETHFLLRVQGDSMTGDDIQDEDLIVVKTQQFANDNELAVVTYEEGSAVKRLKREKDCACLLSSNPDYPPIVVNNLESLRIEGVVVGVARSAPRVN